MFISCPLCRTRFRFDDQKVRSGLIKLRCSRCSAIFRLTANKAERGGRLTILLAHESMDFCAAVEKVLASEPFDIVSCHDGQEALDLVRSLKPDLVLLNVALPTMYGFQVCEALRSNPDTMDIKIILLAAIYDKTKYKRSPQSLYGADDYIEQHHIPDSLAAMIYRLTADMVDCSALSSDAGNENSPEQLTVVEAERQESARKELMSQVPADTAEDIEILYRQARQLARSIVSDISLYREAELEEAVRTGDLELCLGLEIRDGRALYESRMPGFSSFPSDFFSDAVTELIGQKKREMGIGDV